MDVVETLLEHETPESLTVDLVLAASSVSKGSLYHHFDDFSDLIETVLVNLFVKSVDENIIAIRKIISRSRRLEELFAGLKQITEITQHHARRATRFRRARLVALAESRPRLMAKMAKEQSRLTAGYVALFEICQQRGWFNASFSPRAAAVFVQAYTLGKIIDDVTEDQMDPEEWDALILQIVDRVFVAHRPS